MRSNVHNMSNCGIHFWIITLSGFPGMVSFSHFHRTLCGRRAKALRKASFFSCGKVCPLIMDPKLKYITPCVDSFMNFSMFWNDEKSILYKIRIEDPYFHSNPNHMKYKRMVNYSKVIIAIRELQNLVVGEYFLVTKILKDSL